MQGGNFLQRTFGPHVLNPLLVFLDPGRKHVDVLHQARPPAAVGAGAVGQRLMPDDEIAGAAADGARA
jgi:hypothetical protein